MSKVFLGKLGLKLTNVMIMVITVIRCVKSTGIIAALLAGNISFYVGL